MRIPSSTQLGDTARRRTHRVTAIFDAAKIIGDATGPNTFTAFTAALPLPCRNAAMAVRGTIGVVVVELLPITTTLAWPAASASCHASSRSTTPK